MIAVNLVNDASIDRRGMFPYLEFVHPAAVETWDAIFRLRDGSRVVDRVLPDTWRRVLAPFRARADEATCTALEQAFAHWRLVPDDRLLRGRVDVADPRRLARPRGWVNVAAYVRRERPSRATLALGELLDDVRRLVRGLEAMGDEGFVEIGVIGVGDAVAGLDADYGDDEACGFVATVCEVIAERSAADRRVALVVGLCGEAEVARFCNAVQPGLMASAIALGLADRSADQCFERQLRMHVAAMPWAGIRELRVRMTAGSSPGDRERWAARARRFRLPPPRWELSDPGSRDSLE